MVLLILFSQRFSFSELIIYLGMKDRRKAPTVTLRKFSSINFYFLHKYNVFLRHYTEVPVNLIQLKN